MAIFHKISNAMSSLRLALWILVTSLACTAAVSANTELSTPNQTARLQQLQNQLHQAQDKNNPATVAVTLIAITELLLDMGLIDKAVRNLAQIEQITQGLSGNTVIDTLVLKARTAIIRRDSNKALKFLDQAAALDTGHQRAGVIAHQRGNAWTQLQNTERAIQAYADSAKLAGEDNNHLLQAKANANRSRLLLVSGRTDEARTLLQATSQLINQLSASNDKVSLLLHTGRTAQQHAGAAFINPAHQAYTSALQLAAELKDVYSQSLASGYLAELYLSQSRIEEGQKLLNRAIFFAQQIDAAELLYQWQWKLARLLRDQGKRDQSISIYQEAVSNLQKVRYDLDSGYDEGRSRFRDILGPLFFELADILLQRAGSQQGSNDTAQSDRLAARSVIEALKAAELEDYFKDDCVAELQTRTSGIDQVDSHTAVFYPVLLEDRVELLISIGGNIMQFTAPVGRQQITDTINTFRLGLERRTTHRYMRSGRQLYKWLIAPVKDTLASHHIDTLVIVPDGPLRTIPLSALHSGKKFLVQEFAIAYTPGLQLTDARPLAGSEKKILLNGLTQAVQGFSALPHVENEIKAISSIFDHGQFLQDEEYTAQRVHNELSAQPYSIVHIASHGQFSGDADKTFLLAWDDKIYLDNLQSMMGLGNYRKNPVELLTLSACQTAAGDDRAALGLAGIAVKAGARSALATLWFVNDQATSDIVTRFYQGIQEEELHKAQALQQAQIALLKQRRFRHPAYWGAFLIIGNWL